MILAAGAGRRLGGVAKALLPAAPGCSFLARIAQICAPLPVGVVVLGPPHGSRVAAEASRLGLAYCDNPRPERGMGSSVATGFAYLTQYHSRWRGALLWPVDHALVRPETVSVLRQAIAEIPESEQRIVIPTTQGRGGHPVWMGRALWAELCTCGAAPEGARSVVRRDRRRVLRLSVDDPGVLRDVDLPGDLRG